jgi:hypothetical protein
LDESLRSWASRLEQEPPEDDSWLRHDLVYAKNHITRQSALPVGERPSSRAHTLVSE